MDGSTVLVLMPLPYYLCTPQIPRCTQDQTMRLWDLKAQKCQHVLQGHTNRMFSVTFSPDGRILANGSEDQTIRLWDVKTGGYLATLRVPKPYEGTNITDVTGLTEVQRPSLIALGAIERRFI